MRTSLFSLLSPPPPGFTLCVSFNRRDFRTRPFVLLVESDDQADAFLGEHAAQLTGILVTLDGKRAELHREHAPLLHLSLPGILRDQLQELLVPFLDVLLQLQETQNQHCLLGLELTRASATKNRLAAEFDAIRTGLMKEIEERRSAQQQLQESEERFRNLYLHSPDGILLVDIEEKRFITANERICVMLGYSEEELLELGLEDIHPREEMPYVRIQFERQVRQEISLAPELPILRRDGSVFYADVNAYPIMLGGKPHLMGTFRDITERRQAERERQRLQEQLAQSQKMESVGRLAGGVAHDFNNMLGVILGYTDMILQGSTKDSPFHQEIVEIQSAAKRSADLTRQLLAFARKQTVSPRVLDMNETVAGMLRMLKRLIGEQIELKWTPGTDVWPVRIDPSQIDQILANLCVNARDAIDGIGRITISTENVVISSAECREDSDLRSGEYLGLRVRDTGCGIESAMLEHVFEPFYTTKSLGQGTGLGLATVYGIVRQNGGCIKVESVPGQGTTVTILLPKHKGGPPRAKRIKKEGLVKGGPEMLLLVEDEPMLLELCQRLLENLGYRVLPAAMPSEALRLADEHAGEIQLLITDMIMPEMNGLQLSGLLRAKFPALKQMFMSGYTADLLTLQEGLGPGVHVLQKPFSLNDLASRVRKVLDGEPAPDLPD